MKIQLLTAVVTDPQGNTSPEVKTTQQLTWLFRVMWMVTVEKDLTGAPVVEINDVMMV
ncbi:hypothetical protein [Acinetobacter baumannii]|uniref:hypothetical protein n=1 Tax=Acinetobacter baumannii TaxID=470 RepID=UPI0036F4502E